MAKTIDIIAKIYNGIIKGIAIGKTLVALQGSARAGKSFQIMIFLIQCALNPGMVDKLNMANWISRHKAWEEKKALGEECGDEPKQPEPLSSVLISVVRLAMPSIKRSIFRDFVEIMNLMGIYDAKRMNKTDMIYTFENGSIIEFFATADNEQKVRGSKRDILFINEANEVSEWEFTQLRMRSLSFSIVDFNPSFTEEHWLFKKLTDERTYHFVSTFIDNPFLPDAVKEEIMSYKYTNPALWRIFGLGEFAIVEGLVFPKETWDIVDATDIPIDTKIEKRIGIDIGFSGKGDPTAAVLCYYGNINGIKHMWIEELVYDRGLNEKQLAFRLKPYNHIKKYIDSANPLYIQNLEDSGMSLVYPVVKYANSVIDGINKMQGYKLHVIRGSVNVIKELNNYCWMKDRHEAFTNVPIDKFNHACFTGDTLVLTHEGHKRIDQIEIGDAVYNSKGLCSVIDTFDNGIKDVWDMELTTIDGEIINISVTPNHKIKTIKGWKQAQHLNAGDKIFLFNSLMAKNTICTKESDISQEEQKGFISQFGNTITALFQRIVTSIIKMETHGITALKISNALMQVSTYLCMLKPTCKTQSLQNKQEKEWMTPEHTQTNGIEATKEELGTENTANELQKTYNQKNSFVCIVEKLFGKSHKEKLNFAQIDANQHGEENKDLTMKQEFAKSAEKNLLLTNTQKQELAVSNVLASVKVKRKYHERVFNISVYDVHEYFANGLLVSNCDAIRYATMSDRAGRATRKRYTKDELNFGF